MFKWIFWEAVGLLAFLALVFIGIPSVLSLQKPSMPAAKPIFEMLAALEHLDLPVQYEISVTQSGQGIIRPRTRYYVNADGRKE